MALTPLSTSISSNLHSIQRNRALEERSLDRLATGRKVNSVTDNATAFVLAQGLTERAASYSEVGQSIGQAIGAVDAAQNGIDAISQVVKQMKGLAASAQASGSASEQTALETQYNQLRSQIDSLASDTSYNGVSLISSNPGTVTAQGISSNSALSIQGTASDSASLGVTTASGWAGNTAAIQSDIGNLDKALSALQGTASSLGVNNSRLKILAESAQAQANISTQGANLLTGADSAESAASAKAAAAYRKIGLAALRNDINGQKQVLSLINRG